MNNRHGVDKAMVGQIETERLNPTDYCRGRIEQAFGEVNTLSDTLSHGVSSEVPSGAV